MRKIAFRTLSALARILLSIVVLCHASLAGPAPDAPTPVYPRITSTSGAVSPAYYPKDSSANPWPTFWAGLGTDRFRTAITAYGTLGLQTVYTPDYPYWERSDFESPPGSGINYLYSASLWVGGIVNGDTLVSTGADGWVSGSEYYPDGFGAGSTGSVTPAESLADISLRSVYCDSLNSHGLYPYQYLTKHKPLNITCAMRSYVWNRPPLDNCIVYDITITNVGSSDIHQGYFGVYVDADIYQRPSYPKAYMTNIVGSIRDHGVGYIVHSNGNPIDGAYEPGSALTGVIGLKFLGTSFPAADTAFNWFIPSWNYTGISFGPQKRSNTRPLATGASGLPTVDPDRYYLMANHEWDYDQVQLPAIASSDTSWVNPGGSAAYWSEGQDVRFLQSMGPFELAPDSSVRVLFCLITADSIHTDPFILDYLPIVPDLYTANLHLGRLLSVSDAADSAAVLVKDPADPPNGLTLRSHGSPSNQWGMWDPWCLDNTDGVNVYLTQIPDSALPHHGVIPPWYRPEQESLAVQIGKVDRVSLAGITENHAYTLTIANRFGTSVGRHTAPLIFRPIDTAAVPIIGDSLFFLRGDNGVQLQWQSATSVHSETYNVYRFADSAAYNQRFRPYYSRIRSGQPLDSAFHDGHWFYFHALSPYRTVTADTPMLNDSSSFDGAVYAVTSIDSAGFESDFSAPMRAFQAVRSRGILVITGSPSSTNFITLDSLKAYYRRILKNYDFEIYSFVDSVQGSHCPTSDYSCFNWHDLMPFKLVIVDDGLADAVLDYNREQATQAFSRYLESGGELAYFGSFARMQTTPLDIRSGPETLPLTTNFVNRFFGVDSLFWVGVLYYANQTTPFVDTLFGFSRATAVKLNSPSLAVDTAREPFISRLRTYWRPDTPPAVSTFKTNAQGEITHTFHSLTPQSSINEGEPIGVKTTTPTFTTFLFGFHLWYMTEADARGLVSWMVEDITTGIDSSKTNTLPTGFSLDQNYPNPFNPTTRISFGLPRATQVRLVLYNILGQKVTTLVDTRKSAGYYDVMWDGRDSNGEPVASGVYFYRLETPDGTVSKKMLLLR